MRRRWRAATLKSFRVPTWVRLTVPTWVRLSMLTQVKPNALSRQPKRCRNSLPRLGHRRVSANCREALWNPQRAAFGSPCSGVDHVAVDAAFLDVGPLFGEVVGDAERL